MYNHPMKMDAYLYMCGECLEFSGNIDEFTHHVCPKNTEYRYNENKMETSSKKDHENIDQTSPRVTVFAKTFKTKGKAIKICSSGEQESNNLSAYEVETDTEGGVKKRKKYQVLADEYRVNRMMRDKDFKLGRTHLYNFKDTLGDWDERSTKLLIQLVQKYPKSHFLLSTKAERRLGHWEFIHEEMETAGYTFTVLQLRMRWREVLQKYRWTVDYNDSHIIKKKCEYFDEMNELFGNWDEESTQCLLKQMQQMKAENSYKKVIRIGYAGWERMTTILNAEGYRFSIEQVESRWRNMVTLFKTMVDHNALPNVEPRTVGYKDDLEKLVNYVPKRRQIYEKAKGRSVKMERFPTNGIRLLLQAYKHYLSLFLDSRTRNSVVWDKIKQKLKVEGYNYTTLRLKDILNGIIKGYEKSQLHNSLPGAIRRDVSYYRELSEIFDAHGRWPHIQSSRTLEMRNRRKFRLRLQASQQLWSSEESRALLLVYPDVLEAHVNQSANHQCSDLWLQVAKAYAATGCYKRDVPEVAVHIGLLRLGYSQDNLFPFREEMQKVKDTEEAVCYSPAVSKFIGDAEIVYWSHSATEYLLDFYLEHLGSTSSRPRKAEVFDRVLADMQTLGFKYTKENILDHFKTLLTQYRTRTSEAWRDTLSSPTCAPYLEKMAVVFQLRRKLSLSWTSGVTPLDDEAVDIVDKLALEEAEELLHGAEGIDERKFILQLLEQIQSHIRTKNLLKFVPRTRQIRHHLVTSLSNIDESSEENGYIAKLYTLMKAHTHNIASVLKGVKPKQVTNLPTKTKRNVQPLKNNAGKHQESFDVSRSIHDSCRKSLELEVKLEREVHMKDCGIITENCHVRDQSQLEKVLDIHEQSDSMLPRCNKENDGRNNRCSTKFENMLSDVSSCTGNGNESKDVKLLPEASSYFNHNDTCEWNAKTSKDQRSTSEKVILHTYRGTKDGLVVKSQYSGDCIKTDDKKQSSRTDYNVATSQNEKSFIKSEACFLNAGETRKVICTRYRRKTRFTYFPESIGNNFEEQVEKTKHAKSKDLTKACDVLSKRTRVSFLTTPIAGRKRGRPPKIQDSECKSKTLLFPEEKSPKKKRILAGELYKVGKLDHEKCINYGVSLSDSVYPSGNCSNPLVNTVLKRIETTRKESDAKLCSILEDLQCKQSNVLILTLKMLQKISTNFYNIC